MSKPALHRPRKRFGQHFLTDRSIINHIVDSLALAPQHRMVEIGPGQGALTKPLLQHLNRLVAVELDRDLIPNLQLLSTAEHELHIHAVDALRFDFCRAWEGGESIRLVGNLPYNISTPLIFHLFSQIPCIEDMHFMLQKEVVDRMAAHPGAANYGRLSVMVQYHAQVEPLFDIEAKAFTPPPKVVSSFVRLIPYQQKPVQINNEAVFKKLVERAFNQRRKTLRNALKGLVDERIGSRAGVDLALRAEQLSLQQFARLANVTEEYGTPDPANKT